MRILCVTIFFCIAASATKAQTWSLTGNSGTNPPTSFLGTTDNKDVVFKRLSIKAGLLSTSNTSFGLNALPSNTGTLNSVFGVEAGQLNTSGSYNTFMGYKAGYTGTSANANTFVGYRAGTASTANENTYLGYNAGASSTTGGYNVFVGAKSGMNNTTGEGNMFLGASAGEANTTGNSNMFLGYAAGLANTTGNSNTFLGNAAGSANTTGRENVFIGEGAGGANTTATANTYIGTYAGQAATTATANTFIGSSSGNANTTGLQNTFIGSFSGYFNVTGQNVATLGYKALYSSTASNNTAFGASAGFDATSGGNNLFVGYNTGRGITTGANNTIIGANVTGLSATLANNIIIADGSGNRRINVGSTGNVGIGTNSPATALHVGIQSGTSAQTQINVSGIDYTYDAARANGTVAVLPTIGIDQNNGIGYINDGSVVNAAYIVNQKGLWAGSTSTTTRSFKVLGPENNLANYSLEFVTRATGSATANNYWIERMNSSNMISYNRSLNIGTWGGPSVKIFGGGYLVPNKVADIFVSDAGIGINTESPTEKLHVAGNIYTSGKIMVNTPAVTGYELAVNGSAIFTKAVVKLNVNWPDYVFETDYKLPALKDVEAFLKQNKHLPEVPSAQEIKEKGIDLGDQQTILLKKVEELTLYMIDMNKKIEELAKENAALKAQLEK
ncbi:hypothetical protein [Ferruginibacter sp. HRS2-29]|uniref:hypothetical protein n=1 Tax=Ferruginibacter sp. HRS2-29 TaxID=2487334 RepID=UPI0020CCEE99|nr:hypothetical protein [Ferruginibacter sp. HRS2-29]MCP9752377.1 hypothetical protein [Ferruginibacter sp. HRS2-29]